MKKQISLVLIGVMALSLAACGEEENTLNANNSLVENSDDTVSTNEVVMSSKEDQLASSNENEDTSTEASDDYEDSIYAHAGMSQERASELSSYGSDSVIWPEVCWDDLDVLPIIDHNYDGGSVFLEYDINKDDYGNDIDVFEDGTMAKCADYTYCYHSYNCTESEYLSLNPMEKKPLYHIEIGDYNDYSIIYVNAEYDAPKISKDLIYKNGIDISSQYDGMNIDDIFDLMGHGRISHIDYCVYYTEITYEYSVDGKDNDLFFFKVRSGENTIHCN